MNRFENIANHLLPAIAYGDAAGLPVETRSAAYIAEHCGAIRELLPTRENPFYKGEYDVGTWSDDTQLSVAVAKALTKARGFDMKTIADEHVKAYRETPQVTKPSGQTIVRGWGRSTTMAVQRYMEEVPIERCGQPNGAGNGIIMKMAPLAFWHIMHDTPLEAVYKDCDTLTAFTHDSELARITTRVHYDALQYLAGHEYDAREFANRVFWSAINHEERIETSDRRTSSTLAYLVNNPVPTQSDILQKTDGKGFLVTETLAMVYGAFMAHEGKFGPSVYEAVNLGGDTDSTASIVAAMSVIKTGGDFDKPHDYGSTLNFDELQRLSARLSDKSSIS